MAFTIHQWENTPTVSMQLHYAEETSHRTFGRLVSTCLLVGSCKLVQLKGSNLLGRALSGEIPHNLIYGIEKQYPVRYVPGAEFLNNPQPFQPVLDYLLRNCTPDIDEQNCNNCHKESVSEIQTCCGGKQGGRVLKPSCNLSQSLVDIPAPVPAAPAPEEAKKKSNTKQTVIIIVVVLVVFVYFQQHMLFLQSKETKAWRNWREDTVENIIDPVLTRSSWNRSDEIHPHKFTMCAENVVD
ncbi:unnamed protein product [Prunus armeniaca]|uniref:Gnk2-homologous domain-containing protein n=1 Tax=Prunus armeniaca TaxID=36596 RepID=A0A6J5THW4_PRUAR|nr:unnamed protein product [Prunus armeniaca]